MMTGLFDPARHEPLQAPPWDEAAARAAIDRIAAAALADYLPGQGWLAHPLDDPATPGTRCHDLYWGSGGVIWALRHLARAGALRAMPGLPDFAPFVATLRELNRAFLADSRHGTASFLLGDVGIDLLQWMLEPDEALAQRLHDAIRGNLHNPVREALWGNAGTVLAAIHLAEATGQARWGALVREAADALEAELEADPETGTPVWVQQLYGSTTRYLGAGHGFAGNAYPFLRGAALLPAAQVQRITTAALQTLQATALRADGGTNWHPMIDAARVATRLPLVQDCHGAPGIVCRLATAPRSDDWDGLLLEAGELTWRAGPLRKGASLCHGTAGSAMAMLKLWRRTGDCRWLDRARALAMHAAAQVETHRAEYGRGRHSLWTGDLGAACLLWNCIVETDSFPTLDIF